NGAKGGGGRRRDHSGFVSESANTAFHCSRVSAARSASRRSRNVLSSSAILCTCGSTSVASSEDGRAWSRPALSASFSSFCDSSRDSSLSFCMDSSRSSACSRTGAPSSAVFAVFRSSFSCFDRPDMAPPPSSSVRPRMIMIIAPASWGGLEEEPAQPLATGGQGLPLLLGRLGADLLARRHCVGADAPPLLLDLDDDLLQLGARRVIAPVERAVSRPERAPVGGGPDEHVAQVLVRRAYLPGAHRIGDDLRDVRGDLLHVGLDVGGLPAAAGQGHERHPERQREHAGAPRAAAPRFAHHRYPTEAVIRWRWPKPSSSSVSQWSFNTVRMPALAFHDAVFRCTSKWKTWPPVSSAPPV